MRGGFRINSEWRIYLRDKLGKELHLIQREVRGRKAQRDSDYEMDHLLFCVRVNNTDNK
jgi:hypothetical protein